MFGAQTTMLYYRDLAAARAFYGGLLGLEVGFDADWATLYRATATSMIGVIGEHPSAYHQPQARSAVMVSLVVDAPAEVDAWHARLRGGGAAILKPPYDHAAAPIRALLVADPGGYAVELMAWR
ncbi:MAG: VOC family protein [Nannocystaceae bacterium]